MKLSIDWMDGYSNDPRIEVTDIEESPWPAQDAPVWVNRGGLHRTGMYLNDVSPVVHYFYTDGKPTEGYGGRRFQGTFHNGDAFDYRGAWSSRAGVVNLLFPYHRVVDVRINRNIAGAVHSMKLIEEWRNGDYDFGLAWVYDNGRESILLPTRNGQLKNHPGKNGGVVLVSK